MPFRRRRPFVPTSFHHNSLQPIFGDDWRAFFERDSGWFQVFTRSDYISTLSTFRMIFRSNTSFHGFQSPFFSFSPFSPKVEFSCLYPPTPVARSRVFLFVFPPPQKKTIKFGLLGPSRISISPTRSFFPRPGPRRHWRVTIKGRAGRSQECFTGDGFNTLPDLARGAKNNTSQKTQQNLCISISHADFCWGTSTNGIQMMCTTVG